MTTNPFEVDPKWQKEFLKKHPRWVFHNCWKSYKGLRGFNLFNFWWWENGTRGPVCSTLVWNITPITRGQND